MNATLEAKEVRDFPFFTNIFLLQHCSAVPDLYIRSEEEYRLYTELKRIAHDTSVNDEENDNAYRINDKTIFIDKGAIHVFDEEKPVHSFELTDFSRRPSETFRLIKYAIMGNSGKASDAL